MREITDEMVTQAAYALADYTGRAWPKRLYPPVSELPAASTGVAARVIPQALLDGVAGEPSLAELDDAALTDLVRARFWTPKSLPFRAPGQDC